MLLHAGMKIEKINKKDFRLKLTAMENIHEKKYGELNK